MGISSLIRFATQRELLSLAPKIVIDLGSYAIGEILLHLYAFRRYVSGLFVLLLGNNAVFPIFLDLRFSIVSVFTG